MRTVSFSNDLVRQALGDQFVCTFSNTDGDPTAGKSIWHSPEEPAGTCIQGNGKQNVQTIFMTPDKEIFHVATGFLPPEVLAEEIAFAGKLYDAIKNNRDDGLGEARQLVKQAHVDRLRELGFYEQQINGTGNNPMEMITRNMPTFSGFVEDGNGGRMEMSTPFDGFIKQQVLDDNRFSVRHPMMTWDTFQSDPTKLVGNGKSFFASSSSSK